MDRRLWVRVTASERGHWGCPTYQQTREVLTRLLQLNHQRYADDQAQALVQREKETRGTKGKRVPKKNDGRLSKF